MALALGAVVMPSLAPSASATTQPGAGDTVWIGTLVQGHPGTRLHSVYSPVPADTSNPGTPDYWAYCIEHNVSAKTGTTGVAGNVSAFLGTNYYDTDPTIPGKVMWIVANSYPAISLSDFATAAGVPGLTPNDAIEAIQYAIWRYTDLTFDANWNWAGSDSTANAEAAYWYLIGKINQGNTLTPGSASVTATVTAPAGAQQAGTLVGPFTVHTNQPTVSVTVAPGVAVTDAAGTLINTSAVTDGQQIYLDLRGSTTAGSATVTVTAQGAGGTGMTISVPTTSGGTPTTGNHAQSLVLVAASTATTTGSAAVSWTAAPAPSIGTTLVDKADDDHTIPAGGGVVVDTIAYSNLTPGTSYTVTGELRKKSDGSATGITGTKTFTPVSANGTVEVEFTVPAGYAGQSLVAFEELTVTGQPAVVAEHKDINDTAQTVSVQKGAPTVNTQASAATVTVGASLHDVVTITGFVPGGNATGTAVLYGPLSAVNDTVCTEGNVAGTVTFTPANGTITTPTVTVTQPGLYTWQVTVSADDRNDKATHACGLAAETTTVQQSGTGSGGESKVSLTTETSHDQVKPGAQVFDKVTITGFVPGYGATGSATLYGPFASRDKIACTPANAVGTVNFTPGNGVVHTPTVQVNQTGYYTWVASTTADSHNTAASHACGLVSETTLVHKPAYATPTVSTGFANDGWKPAGRRTVDRIRIPSLGVNARTSLVGIKRGTMQVPGNVARTGQLSQSAAADDLIGTTVIAGHVSDRHDRPGAFWKLTKIRKGKVVTLWQGGKKLRYRVTSIQRFSRTSKLPDRFFSTTGEHQLVLISCAGKVTTSSGGFHYRQNVVVTAVPLG
ncbi:VaFE repeat-containing surface-anchored protein [Nocardioides sp. QY071]|uniref:VaFE repeat-containing surface-anchored protein n=1 Tax=Nocardioides sp. QY071 TaxID=3044187 RepID=UPI00249A0032|nr:VaFE repeat-containing surface-anchored protein [Nocardioides sp. QY071]WGY02476.1 VaFE repeat-containing surface-anchored protein [Nocardioides sp. QY071]